MEDNLKKVRTEIKKIKKVLANQTNAKQLTVSEISFKGEPTSYFPIAIDSDYSAGNIIRYFTKKD
jgi:hypothetical protein